MRISEKRYIVNIVAKRIALELYVITDVYVRVGIVDTNYRLFSIYRSSVIRFGFKILASRVGIIFSYGTRRKERKLLFNMFTVDQKYYFLKYVQN